MITGLEKEILGQLILSPKLLELDLLGADFFNSENERKIFAGITTIWEEGRPDDIDIGILAEKTGLSLELIDGLASGNYRPTAESFAWRVRELRRRRASERALRLAQDEGQRLVKTGEVDPASLQQIRAAFAELDELAGQGFDPYAFMKTGAQLQALDIHVDWVVEKLIPEGAITLLHGPGGLGKTWLCLALAKAISEGSPFLGLATKKREVVYINYENPLAVIHDRAIALNVCAPHFWSLSDPTRPPKIDGPDWPLLKALRPGATIFFDTARGGTVGDENKSQDVALVMNNLKELRELGHDIILQAHTTKLNKKLSRGATTWEDLADHAIAFYRVRPGTLVEIEEEGFDPNALLFLGTGEKTRYEPCRFYLSLDTATGTFALAESPDAKNLDALADYISAPGFCKNQSEILGWAQDNLGGGRNQKFIALLKRGEHEGRWKSRKGLKGAKLYEPTS